MKRAKPVKHEKMVINGISRAVGCLMAVLLSTAAYCIEPLGSANGNLADPAPQTLVDTLTPAPGFEAFGAGDTDRSFQAGLQFFETVLSYGPPQDPTPVFLMVNSYLAANQQQHGIAFLEVLFATYPERIQGDVRASYLAAHAILRATYADNVSLYRRIGWMLDTFEMLDEAQQLADPDNPLVHWSAGLIYAQVPWFFDKEDNAIEELNWLVDHPESEPTPGFFREAYRYLSKLHADRGNTALARDYLVKSGYESYEPHTLFMGWFTTTRTHGLTFAPRQSMEEVVPGRVFALRGFGFSEVYFVISEDEQSLIVIDAGTQPFSIQAAYEYLRARRPSLPPLTTALITHAHWDHIGGYTYLQEAHPGVRFYGRGNYKGTLERVQKNHSYQQFRSTSYHHEWVAHYRPDVAVDTALTITVGGTSIELVPVTGGETEDALLIHLPDHAVMFVGDVLMPFYGEPWTEEGFPAEAVAVMDEIISRNPEHVLHGHFALTFLYDLEAIRVFRDAHAWLVDATRKYIYNGYSAKDIVRLNLIPPGLEQHPHAFVGYLSPRDHIINRVADQLTGIWQENATGKEPQGLDSITSIEYGRLFSDYLQLSPKQVATVLERALAAGDNELALQLAVAAENRYADTSRITVLKEEAADRLRSINQFLDPFKFVVYTEMIGKEHKPIPEGFGLAESD